MESSKRAVEAYKRTRMVDLVITDDDKVAPVYRLDEISDMLRSSSSDMVREVVEYTMKRLGSKGPRVKQKILRMIKFVVPKGGSEFKRQVQRQSAVIRQLFDYKGQPDALRGDALNKAVRDTAHEAIAAIFASDDNKPSQSDDVNKRIMGFGSTNYDPHLSSSAADSKKPSLTDVVSDVIEFGSASLKQGLTILSGYAGANTGNTRTDLGSYRGPALRKSLTSERETFDRFDRTERGDSRVSSEHLGANAGSGSFTSHASQQEPSTTRSETRNSGDSSLEERLLDTITAPGGMRLQPTRENMQKFLTSAVKLNQNNFYHALESRLHSHAWQVRFKALCVVEAILRQKDEEFFEFVAKNFIEDASAIQDCVQSPQASVRDKALKILDNLGSKATNTANGIDSEVQTNSKQTTHSVIVHDMPNLIDTGDSDLLGDEKNIPQVSPPAKEDVVSGLSSTRGHDLLGDDSWTGNSETTGGAEAADDVFAGLSFHTSDRTSDELSGDLFSGLSVDNTPSSEGGIDFLLNGSNGGMHNSATSSLHVAPGGLEDLMGNISLKDSRDNGLLNGLVEKVVTFSNTSSTPVSHHSNTISSEMLASLSNPQLAHMSPSVMLPMGMVGGYQAPIMIPQNFGNAFIQPEILSRMMGLQKFNTGVNGGNIQGTGSAFTGDIFDFSGDGASRLTTESGSAKKEETKAFDFISDHISAARVTKKS